MSDKRTDQNQVVKDNDVKDNDVKDSGVKNNNDIFSEDFCIALNSTTIPVYIIDPENFRVVYCNEALLMLLGKNPMGECCYNEINTIGAPCPDCVALRLYRDGINEKSQYRMPNGKWVLVRVSPFMWRGKEYYKLICIDITEQKQLEAELRLRNKEYSAVIRQSTSGVMRYDIATGTAAVNVDGDLNKVEEYNVDDYMNMICRSGMIEEKSIPTVQGMFDDIRSGKESRGYDLLITSSKGRKCWSHLDYSLICDDNHNPYRAVVSFYDNTQKREQELAYEKWNERISALMNDYTAYMEVNLTKDIIETDNRVGAWDQDVGGRCYSRDVREKSKKGIYEEDRVAFRKFFNRERLLGQFMAGNSEGVLEYRVTDKGKPLWHKADVHIVSDPASGDVKATIILSNIDVNLRERELLTQKAERDVMTGVYNHATTERLIDEALNCKTGKKSCFLIIDLDDLRDINSSLGHPEGDRAIKAIAECMVSHFGDHNILGRIGGDEFVAFLKNVPMDDEELHINVDLFLQKLNETFIGSNNDRPIHASIGGAIGVSGMDNFESLYHMAYYTKAKGKNAFHMYRPEFEDRNFEYHPQSAVTITRIEAYDDAAVRRLMKAIATVFPMVISVNLTQNTYYMMEYMSYKMQRHRDKGNFDKLIEDGARSFHPDDRESFVKCFARKNLLEAYARGERFVLHTGRQLGDDGIYRTTQGIVIFIDDEATGDVCEITFSHVVNSADKGEMKNAAGV